MSHSRAAANPFVDVEASVSDDSDVEIFDDADRDFLDDDIREDAEEEGCDEEDSVIGYDHSEEIGCACISGCIYVLGL